MEKRMRKLLLWLLLLVAVLLAGCLQQPQATPTSSPTIAAQPTPTVGLMVPEESVILPDPGCTVITQKPTPGPTQESAFPPISDTDWVKGPVDAKVTIIEYSDFQ